jgi:DNA-binding transcriptional MerR regulator
MPPRTVRADRVKKGRDVVAARSLTVASPSVGTPTLTVGEIAEQLGKVAPDAVATRERLRHWTREGLLAPVDRHHAGTGKHRRYDADSTYDAAILNAVASAGLHVVTQRYLIEALAMARHARRKWERTGSRGPLLLEISQKTAGGGTTIAIHEGAVQCDPTAELSIVINMAQIFANVRSNDT